MIHNLIILVTGSYIHISSLLQISMLLGVKRIVTNSNKDNLIYYGEKLLKLIKKEKNHTNPNLIAGVINQISSLTGKAGKDLLYLILTNLYSDLQNFQELSAIEIVKKALIDNFKKLFPSNQPVLSYAFQLYQLMLVIICEIYEKLFRQQSIMEKDKTFSFYTEFQFFLSGCVPSLFTLNALIYCCCQRIKDISKFSLITFQIDKTKFKLNYENEKKDETIKNMFTNYFYFIFKSIANFIQVRSNLEGTSIVYSRKEIYDHVIFFFKNIDFEKNQTGDFRKENDFIYYTYNFHDFFSTVFHFDISYGTDLYIIVSHIESLVNSAFIQKLDNIFVYQLMIYLNNYKVKQKGILIHIIGKMVLKIITRNGQKLDSYSTLHFGNLLSTLNYITIHQKEGVNLYPFLSKCSMLEDIKEIINENNFFSCPIIFNSHLYYKGKLMLELFMELLTYLMTSSKNTIQVSVQQLFELDDIDFILDSFDKHSVQTNNQSKNTNLPSIAILNCNLAQYIIIKYILLREYIGNNKTILKLIDSIIDQCLQRLSKENLVGDEFKSKDVLLYNISNIIKSESNDDVNLLDKVKQHVKNQSQELSRDYVFQLSISDIHQDKYKQFHQNKKEQESYHQHSQNQFFLFVSEGFGDQVAKKPVHYHRFREYKYNQNFKNENYIILNFKNEIFLGKFGFLFKKYYFYNEDFIKMKKYFLYKYRGNGFIDKGNAFPSKIKNFSQLYYPKLFIKQDLLFFDNPLLSVSHAFFRNKAKKRKTIKIKHKKRNFLKIFSETKYYYCELVNITKPIFGILTLSNHYMVFAQSKNMNESFSTKPEYTDTDKYLLYNIDLDSEQKYYTLKSKIIFYSQIKEIIVRRYLLIVQGIEIFLYNGKTYFLNFLHSSFLEDFLNNLKPKDSITITVKNAKKIFENVNELSEKWAKGNITNFDYLLMLNYFSTRTFNDVNQYPVFPWLSLMNDKGKLDRDFRYPITCQNKVAKQNVLNHYDSTMGELSNFQKHYGTHYSTSTYIYYYLTRSIPHMFSGIILQNNSLDNPNRMFSRFTETQIIIEQGFDNREIIPELFCSVDLFLNLNYAFLGKRTDKKIINDFCYNFDATQNVLNVVKIIIWHRNALESSNVRNNLEKFIDWVFGVNQLPTNHKERREKCCVFSETSYSQKINLEKMYQRYLLKQKDDKDDLILEKFKNIIPIILNFGVAPMQIFFNYHPKAIKSNDKIIQKKTQKYKFYEEKVFYTQFYVHNDTKYLITFNKVQQKTFLYSFSIYTIKSEKLRLKLITQIYFRNVPSLTQINSKFAFLPIDKTIFVAHVLDCSNTISLFLLQVNKKMTNKQYIYNNKLTSIVFFFFNDKIMLFVGMQNGRLLLFAVDTSLSIQLENSIIAHRNSVDFISPQKLFSLVLTASNNENEIYVRKVYDLELITVITLDQNYFINDIQLSNNNLYYILCKDINKEQYTVFGYTLNGVYFTKTKDINDIIVSMNITSNGKVIIVLEKGLKLYHGAILDKEFHNEPISTDKTNISVFNDISSNQCKAYILDEQGKFYLHEISERFKSIMNENQHYTQL